MNALAAAIPAIANESAIATAPAAPASRPAESPTPATKSTAKSTATSAAESTAARSTSTTAARSNGSTWNTARLAFDPRSREAPGAPESQTRARAIRNHPDRFASRCSAIRSPGKLRWRLRRRWPAAGRCLAARLPRSDPIPLPLFPLRRGSRQLAAGDAARTLLALSGGAAATRATIPWAAAAAPAWICLRAVWNPNIWTSTV